MIFSPIISDTFSSPIFFHRTSRPSLSTPAAAAPSPPPCSLGPWPSSCAARSPSPPPPPSTPWCSRTAAAGKGGIYREASRGRGQCDRLKIAKMRQKMRPPKISTFLFHFWTFQRPGIKINLPKRFLKNVQNIFSIIFFYIKMQKTKMRPISGIFALYFFLRPCGSHVTG